MNEAIRKLAALGLLAILGVVFAVAGCFACTPAEMTASHSCCKPGSDCAPAHSSDNQTRCDLPDLGTTAQVVSVPHVLAPADALIVPVITEASFERVAEIAAAISPPDPLSLTSVLRI